MEHPMGRCHGNEGCVRLRSKAPLALLGFAIAGVLAIPGSAAGGEAEKGPQDVQVKLVGIKTTQKLKGTAGLSGTSRYTAKEGYTFVCVAVAMKVPQGSDYANAIGQVQYGNFTATAKVGREEKTFSVDGSGDESRGFTVGGVTTHFSVPARKDEFHMLTLVFVVPTGAKGFQVYYKDEQLKKK